MVTDGQVSRWNQVEYDAAAERLLTSALMMPGPAGEVFSARGGRRVNGAGLAVSVGGSPEAVTVTPGAGVIYDSGFASAGPWPFEIPTSKSLTLPARPASGQSRIDLVIARIYDVDSGAGSVREVKIEHVAGSPGASPSAPTLPALSVELARLTVPNSASITVTPSTTRAVAAGGILPVATTAERDAIASPYAGLMVFNAQTGRLETYNGTLWDYQGRTQTYEPTVAAAAATAAGRFTVRGDWVTVELVVTFTGAATGIVLVPPPVAAATGQSPVVGTSQMLDTSVGTISRLAGIVSLSGTLQLAFQAINGNPNAYAAAAVPWVWAAGDTISATATYRRA